MTVQNQILDGLPFGLVALIDDQIVFANRLFRSLFEGEVRSLQALASRFPELEALAAKENKSSQAPIWLTIAASNYCVISAKQGELTQYAFLPSWIVSETDTGLAAMQKNFDDFVEIFENCFDGIYVADGEGRTLWMNAGFERCYGLSARNFLGRDASKLETEGYLDPLITMKIISTKQRQTALQTTKSGRKVLATGIPLFAADGSVRRVIINSRDTTELIEMQGKLTAAEQEIRSYETELRQIREISGRDGEFSWFSDTMQDIVSLAMRVARTDAPVCISGPAGVGKRKLSDLIFRHSKRNKKRLLRIGFGDLPEEMMMADLFGSGSAQRNDGLLAGATGGTLVLERVDLMPQRVQEKLSNWLRDEVARTRGAAPAVRLISTHQGDLADLVSKGVFREDLYFRLNVASVTIPQLNSRVADIVGLAEQFLTSFNAAHKTDKRFEPAALNRLSRWTWPGNVRELRTVIERLVVTEAKAVLSSKAVDHALGNTVGQTAGNPDNIPQDLTGETIQTLVRKYEAVLLREQVARSGSVNKAANDTGISSSTIKRKLAWLRQNAEN